jgi:hypothetical protein
MVLGILWDKVAMPHKGVINVEITAKKRNKFEVIEYLIVNGATLQDISDATIANLVDTGFIFGNKEIPTTPEIMAALSKHIATLKDDVLFPGSKGHQSVVNLTVSLAGYLKATGNRTLSDIGIQGVYSPRQVINFDNMADLRKYLAAKLHPVVEPQEPKESRTPRQHK